MGDNYHMFETRRAEKGQDSTKSRITRVPHGATFHIRVLDSGLVFRFCECVCSVGVVQTLYFVQCNSEETG